MPPNGPRPPEPARDETPVTIDVEEPSPRRLFGLGRRRKSPSRRITFDSTGITWEDGEGTRWTLRWEELSGVSLCRGIAGLFCHRLPDTQEQIAGWHCAP